MQWQEWLDLLFQFLYFCLLFWCIWKFDPLFISNDTIFHWLFNFFWPKIKIKFTIFIIRFYTWKNSDIWHIDLIFSNIWEIFFFIIRNIWFYCWYCNSKKFCMWTILFMVKLNSNNLIFINICFILIKSERVSVIKKNSIKILWCYLVIFASTNWLTLKFFWAI